MPAPNRFRGCLSYRVAGEANMAKLMSTSTKNQTIAHAKISVPQWPAQNPDLFTFTLWRRTVEIRIFMRDVEACLPD